MKRKLLLYAANMDIQEIVELAEQLLKDKTGKGLTDLQREILQRAWDKQTYDDLIKDKAYTSSYVRTVGADLFKLLSGALEKNIKKTNFRKLLEGLERLQISIGNDNSFRQDCIEIKFCSSTLDISKNQAKQTSPVTSYYSLEGLHRASNFYGRIQELETVQQVLNHQSINLYGLKGIGKTSLIAEIIPQVKEEFTCIFYQDLTITTLLEEIEVALINDIQGISFGNESVENQKILSNPKQRRNWLLKLLREIPCLIIFDQVESLFIAGELAGQYQHDYQDYKILFQQILNLQGKSRLILVSDVKIEDYGFSPKVFSLPLQDLETTAVEAILSEIGLIKDAAAEKFLASYQGHPGWLRQATVIIKEFFDGDFSLTLLNNSVLITESMKRDIQSILNSLSIVEKDILMGLVHYDDPVSLDVLCSCFSLSLSDLVNAIKSLGDRSLITKISTGKKQHGFMLMPVIKVYFKEK